ncbi:MAG: TRAP transporter small permease subunit [Atribacterota bacterium]|nr:TRAP transporter small permease subunit [Atribacterota bacterium]MDD5636694.1 TRAP transporter small permease subunit [Atribacterota bacterium]
MIMKYEVWIERISYYLDKISRIFVVILMIIMFVLVLITIANRFIFHFSFSWSEEIARYLFIWIIMIGIGIAEIEGSHVALELPFIKKRTNSWIKLTTRMMMLIFFIIVIWNGISSSLFLFQKYQTSAVSGIPMYLIFVSIPIGFGILAIHTLVEIESIFKTSMNERLMKERKYK